MNFCIVWEGSEISVIVEIVFVKVIIRCVFDDVEIRDVDMVEFCGFGVVD